MRFTMFSFKSLLSIKFIKTFSRYFKTKFLSSLKAAATPANIKPIKIITASVNIKNEMGCIIQF